jgi:hypothetical protein
MDWLHVLQEKSKLRVLMNTVITFLLHNWWRISWLLASQEGSSVWS